MSWLSLVTGLMRPARELIEVLGPPAEQAAGRGQPERLALTRQDLAALRQLASALQERSGRTWWDALIDGLNRLPRPLITLGSLAFLVLAPLAPVRFLEIARAYQMMPDGFWALLSVIVAFYFGGRMQLKRRDLAVGALGAILAIRRAAPTPDPSGAGRTTTPPRSADGVVEPAQRRESARDQR